MSEQSDAKTATIDELQLQVSELSAENDALQKDLQGYLGTDGTLKSGDSLMKAAQAYITNPEDVAAVADYLEEIEEETPDGETDHSEAYTNLYDTLIGLVGADIAETYYNDGYDAYRQENFEDAIPNLEKAFKYDPTNGEALYDLANSYYRAGQEEQAKETYQKVIELFPDTEKANKSEEFLADLENQN